MTTMTSSVQLLPSEILLVIFTMNSEMLRLEERKFLIWKESELGVTQRTSQVCRTWRSLTLNSPHIWANCLDLDLLKHRKRYREQIRKRIGLAALSIRGFIDAAADFASQDPFLSFLSSLLNENWNRIRSFDVKILGCGRHHDAFWRFLQQRNPTLQTFVMQFEGAMPREFTELDDRAPLFAGDAPSLQTFQWVIPIPLSPQTKWFSQLSELGCKLPSLSTRVENLARRVSALWDPLSQIRGLKTLKLVNCIQENSALPITPINLQSLQYLEISCDLRHCFQLLDSLILHPTICLNLTLTSHPLFKARIEPIASRFQCMTAAYLAAWRRPTQMNVQVTPTLFLLSFGSILPHDKHFKIEIQTTSVCPMSSLIQSIPFGSLDEVAGLDLVIAQDTQLDQTAKSQLLSLFAQLPSITRFGPSPEALRFATSASKNAAILPALKTLKVHGENPPAHFFNTQALANCSTFLSSRKQAGQPQIETLDLRFVGAKANMVDLRDLDGLKIIKNINGRLVEYIHGMAQLS
ncbi:hypothetical protein CPB83DRAFT_369126 [Crepidotus variabilis]|uniref:F-box domain-containing protein n=1 Tax=Crepidotus variabilis TaxID=179855 RepID=A0A9P6JPN7_9AGAR|nr:hypothetical protein CPB83DRAFT_369126 [Crepidotus variabilis]